MTSKIKKATPTKQNESDNESEKEKVVPKKRKAIEVKDSEVLFELNPKKKVCVRKFKNVVYIDIREYYEKHGETLPGKKGISLTKDLWEKLKEFTPEIDEALENF